MPSKRSLPYHTETPFLPQPLAGDVLASLVVSVVTIEEGEALRERLALFRHQVSSAIDTIELSISQNHADYLAGRRSWSYDTRIEIETRLRILKRQRQHLQEAFGQCNRRLKHLLHMQQEVPSPLKTPASARAVAFVQAATRLLDASTIAMLWEIVEQRGPRTDP